MALICSPSQANLFAETGSLVSRAEVDVALIEARWLPAADSIAKPPVGAHDVTARSRRSGSSDYLA
jgi:hypothetical protein